MRLDLRAARCDPERERSQNAGGYARYEAVADLLQHEVHGRVCRQGPVVPLRYPERDEEERDADPVVEAALDVETLPDPRRDPLVGHDRLAERCVRAGEHDRQHQRLDHADAGQNADPGERAGRDRQGQPDSEQACRYGDSVRSAGNEIREASANRTSVSVASARSLTGFAPRCRSMSPSAGPPAGRRT